MNQQFFKRILQTFDRNLLVKTLLLISTYSSVLMLSSCVTSSAEVIENNSVQVTEGPAVVAKPTIEPEQTIAHPPIYPISSTPYVTAGSAIVMDAATGEIMFAKSVHEKRAVASTQKLMTALLAQEHMPGATVTVPREATLLEPSKLYVKTGSRYSMEHLVKALMVKSANDIAYVIAHNVAGSEPEFEVLMNEKAKRLRMNNSHFKNPHGLTEEGQYSTAFDIALLARAAYQDPYIRECVSTKSMTFVYADGRTKPLNNTNKILTRVPYCTGMKTGTTNASKYCLVSSGELNGRAMIVVVLGAPSRATLLKESEGLLRWSLER